MTLIAYTTITELSFEEVERLAIGQGECQVEQQNEVFKVSTTHGSASDLFALGKLIGKAINQKKQDMSTLSTKQIKEKLSSLKDEEVFQMPGLMSPKSIVDLLEFLSEKEINLQEDWNGWELDYSGTFLLESITIQYWGSAYEGTLLFRKK